MATDRYVFMHIDDIRREAHEAQRNVRPNKDGRDSAIRTVAQLKRNDIVAYGKILRALGYGGSIADARRVFLDPALRAKVDEEWRLHEEARGKDELIIALELMEERIKRREE